MTEPRQRFIAGLSCSKLQLREPKLPSALKRKAFPTLTGDEEVIKSLHATEYLKSFTSPQSKLASFP